MNKPRLFLAAAIAVAAVAYALGRSGWLTNAPAVPVDFKEIALQALSPSDWDPIQRFQQSNRGALDDGDPNTQRLMRAIWDNAPTIEALDGAAVKLAGYVVPLEEAQGAMSEFLLVPYFGACLHSPPPPANQIVHVAAHTPIKGLRAMDVVWVSGTLKTGRMDSSMGISGYRLDAIQVDAYVKKIVNREAPRGNSPTPGPLLQEPVQ